LKLSASAQVTYLMPAYSIFKDHLSSGFFFAPQYVGGEKGQKGQCL
jgi:hypothetical protein